MMGVYLNLLFCAYGHFLTFCIVMDSCLHENEYAKDTCLHVVNRGGRFIFHTMFFVLLACVYFARTCEAHLYPVAFVFVGGYILSQQVFDFVFYWSNYLVDFHKMPPLDATRLYYNEALFKRQMKVLFISNIIFGSLSIITICVGFKFINKMNIEQTYDDPLLCYNNNNWIDNSLAGVLFLMCH